MHKVLHTVFITLALSSTVFAANDVNVKHESDNQNTKDKIDLNKKTDQNIYTGRKNNFNPESESNINVTK